MNVSTNLNRRSFIKGAALAGVAAAATGLAACSTDDESLAATGASEMAWDSETDVLVVGFGGAGAVSAVTAFEEGSAVMILEKAPHTGGGVSGVSGANTCGVLDADKAFEYVKAACQGSTPDEVLRAWADEGATLADWLDEHGIGYEDRGDAVGFSTLAAGDEDIARTLSLTDPDDKANAGGHYFIQWATQFMEDNGIEIRFDTQATDLVQDPATKAILGVKALSSGREVAIRAKKAVILATGGFEANSEMMANYVRPWPVKPGGWPFNTGDGIKMAQAVGADLWHMANVCGSGYVFDEPDHIIGRTNFKNYVQNGAFLFVNRHGERFQCEHPATYWSHLSTLAYDRFDESRKQATTGYRDIPFYIVFDETLRSAGSLFPDKGKVSGMPLVPADLGGQDHTWSDDNQEEIEMGWILKADTLEELAQAINEHAAADGFAMEGSALAATVERFNGFCAARQDDDFGRPADQGDSDNLIALTNPPYYAMRFVPSLCSTCGGPVKNALGQILDVKGAIIPRLYGAGVVSHAAGFTYPFSGFNWSEVFNGGRIAGRNAAAEQSLDAEDGSAE